MPCTPAAPGGAISVDFRLFFAIRDRFSHSGLLRWSHRAIVLPQAGLPGIARGAGPRLSVRRSAWLWNESPRLWMLGLSSRHGSRDPKVREKEDDPK